MASDENGDAPARATVALVAEKVDGLKELTTAGFLNVQRQLDRVASTPAELVEVRSKYHELSRRVLGLEQAGERHLEWRRGPLLAVAVAVALAAFQVLIKLFE